MTRPYPHRPDVELAEDSYPEDRQFVEEAYADLPRRSTLDNGAVSVTFDVLWDALAWGWLIERPVPELRALITPAADLVRLALGSPAAAEAKLYDTHVWVATALLAGDDEVAARAGALGGAPAQDAEWFMAGLAALARGDDEAARECAARLRAAVVRPTTAPDVALALEHLGELADAVVDRDQGAFEAALVGRAEAVARAHRTAAGRRSPTGILDPVAIGMAEVATRRGLTVPLGVAVVPVELLSVPARGAV